MERKEERKTRQKEARKRLKEIWKGEGRVTKQSQPWLMKRRIRDDSWR